MTCREKPVPIIKLTLLQTDFEVHARNNFLDWVSKSAKGFPFIVSWHNGLSVKFGEERQNRH